jgi:Zn-dependent M28 family amino/carboxypeptidase
MADFLLRDKNMTLSSIQKQIDQNLKPQSFALDMRLRISADVTYEENATGHNVLGYVAGSDPDASRRVVIIGAHYDHVGRDADGSIFRGANDDASGIAVMMEIARVFASGVRPKWSVLFAAWSGEEEGLVGSEAYVNDPYFPLDQTIAYLNLDMVGGEGPLLCEISQTHENLFEVMTESRQELGVPLKIEEVSADSDHWSFEDRNVPSLMLIYWPDSVYHTTRDIIDHVSKQKLLETARLTSLMALKLSQATVTAMTLTTVAMTTESISTRSQGPPEGGFPTEILIIVVVLIAAGSAAFVYFRRRSR